MFDVAKKAYLTVRGQPAPTQTTRVQLTPTRLMRGHTEAVEAVAFFKDGRRVVTGSCDKTLLIWDVEKGELVGGPFEGHRDWVRSVAVSPHDKRIVSGGRDNNIIIWRVNSKQMVFDPLVKHTGEVLSVCFSPDGKRLASGSYDRTVVIWNAKTRAVLATLTGHDNLVWSVAFSPDGLKLASGSYDGTVRVWGTDNADLLLKIDAHQHDVRRVVWSPDGQQLVSASYDENSVKFWNSSNGDQIGQPCTGHTSSICSLAISSDGSFIATTGLSEMTVRLWNTKTHQEIGQTLEHAQCVRCVAISPNGKLLVGGVGKGEVQLWSIKNILEHHRVEKRGKDDEEAQRQQLLILSDTQRLRSPDTNNEFFGNNDSASNHSSEGHQASGSDGKHSFGILAINTTVRDACIAGDWHAAEDLLTQEINADVNNHDLYANRSVARARNFDWDKALEDSVKSITIQPSLLGYISKAIALCANEQLWDAMEAFDLAVVSLDRNPITVDILLLIKVVALFNASRHDEAMRRVQDLAVAYKRSDALPCSIVNLYLRVQLAIISFDDGRYSEAADQLNDIIPSITDLVSRREISEPRLKIFTVLFGWDLDSLLQTANQRRCNSYLRADRVIEAIESYQHMTCMIDEGAKDSYLEWSISFKKNCTARCVTKGDEAVTARNYENAVELYSAGIGLDSSCECLFARRSKANLEQNLYAEALHDANKAIELNPSSYHGHEVKHAALHKARRYGEAIEALKIMLSKFHNTSDLQMQKLLQRYVRPSEADRAIRRAIHDKLENAPLRLLNTYTGLLCDRGAQINAFMESTEYKEILSSSMTRAPLQMEPIKEAVEKYFSWAMLSHRWQSNELLLHDIQGKVVYDLDSVGTAVKLQTFCKIARDAGYHWSWSDTCCIDQKNNVELQESVNSMFVWYHHSALTIVYLSDVPPSAKSGALANSVWNTRGWTVQEFLAPSIVIFYRSDWTPYLDDCSSNHKKSVAIMQELHDSTGIDARALVAFRPGMTGAREKLQWASNRVTTLQEDIAYSLFGIFGVHLPVIYGEKKQNALGRLLQEIIAQSGDITALDWVGKSSEFNSCLPADIASYKSPPCLSPSLCEDRIQTLVSLLQGATVVELALTLYTRLERLSAARFANRRLRLHCIAFPVTALRRRRGQGQETHLTYEVKADGLQDLLITTKVKLRRTSFLLIRPWNRHDLGLPDDEDNEDDEDDEDDAQSAEDLSESEPPSNKSLSSYTGEDKPVDLESHWRALGLIVRLGQPFGALLLAQQRGGEYKRVASDHNIIAQVKDMAAVHDMMDIRTLEIL